MGVFEITLVDHQHRPADGRDRLPGIARHCSRSQIPIGAGP